MKNFHPVFLRNMDAEDLLRYADLYFPDSSLVRAFGNRLDDIETETIDAIGLDYHEEIHDLEIKVEELEQENIKQDNILDDINSMTNPRLR